MSSQIGTLIHYIFFQVKKLNRYMIPLTQSHYEIILFSLELNKEISKYFALSQKVS